MTPTSFHQLFASIDFGAVGGSLLMIDMLLFAVLAANWEAAGRHRLFARKRKPHKR